MKITIESTDKIVTLNGVPARVWEGKTDLGVEVHAFITRIAVREGQPDHVYHQFERELTETRVASAEAAQWPDKMVL